MIDLRSDTVTKPTQGMWDAMYKAPVGDDVFREDPGLHSLEIKIAKMFGKEAGVFVPSGTMGNQLGIKVQTHPADEVLVDINAHIFHAEGAAGSLISGVQLNPLPGNRGILTPDMVKDAIRERNDWEPYTSVVSIENTSNKGGGTCYPLKTMEGIYEVAKENQLAMHIDGARIWNASIATGIDFLSIGSACDTISVCFSKGLGAPVGSMILGSEQDMQKARRFRKILGGGMRQAGMLAAAASYAVDHHLSKLAEDHIRAKNLAVALSKSACFELNPDHVETNIVLFKVVKGTVENALEWFRDRGIAMIPFGNNTIRATLHLEINNANLETVIDAVRTYKSD